METSEPRATHVVGGSLGIGIEEHRLDALPELVELPARSISIYVLPVRSPGR